MKPYLHLQAGDDEDNTCSGPNAFQFFILPRIRCLIAWQASWQYQYTMLERNCNLDLQDIGLVTHFS
jgi:hypothetical protein